MQVTTAAIMTEVSKFTNVRIACCREFDRSGAIDKRLARYFETIFAVAALV